MLVSMFDTFSLLADDQELEPADGKGLQDLWRKYRKIAKYGILTTIRLYVITNFGDSLPHSDPPSPDDLSLRLQQHMYPFLQCVALFLNCLTGVSFVHSSGT